MTQLKTPFTFLSKRLLDIPLVAAVPLLTSASAGSSCNVHSLVLKLKTAIIFYSDGAARFSSSEQFQIT